MIARIAKKSSALTADRRERNERGMRKLAYAALMAALLLLPSAALGAEMDAEIMELWLERFAQALGSLPVQGDPQLTADPARPGEYLLEYTFGTVTASTAYSPAADAITEIDVRTAQVTDCRGMRVGMTLEEVLSGSAVGKSNTQLYVLGTQEAGLGFSWAYLGAEGVYGVEHITYGGTEAAMKEYTLTYVIDENERVSAIRVRCADTTLAQAQQAMSTADEIAQRQKGEVYAVKNAEAALVLDDLQVMGVRALGMQVSDLIALLGEPVEVQTLSGNQGRLLLYEGAMVELALHEQTGEEVVTGVSASASDVSGPRALAVGMSVQEAAALYRCDEDVYAVGGTLYAEQGEGAQHGELVRGALGTETMLRYVTAGENSANLDVSVQGGVVSHWHFYIDQEDERHGG